MRKLTIYHDSYGIFSILYIFQQSILGHSIASDGLVVYIGRFDCKDIMLLEQEERMHDRIAYHFSTDREPIPLHHISMHLQLSVVLDLPVILYCPQIKLQQSKKAMLN